MSDTATIEAPDKTSAFIPIRIREDQHLIGYGRGGPDSEIIDGQRLVKQCGGGETGLKRLYELRDAGVIEFVNDGLVPALDVTTDDYMAEAEVLHNQVLAAEEERDEMKKLLDAERQAHQKTRELLASVQAQIAMLRGETPAAKPQTRTPRQPAKPQPTAPQKPKMGPPPATPGVHNERLTQAEVLKATKVETQVNRPIEEPAAGFIPTSDEPEPK